MQEDSTILENKEPKDDNAIDIKSLLETANSSRFDDEETLLREKETFEKADSFFDLIKSNSEAEIASNSETDPSTLEDNKEELANEQLAESISSDQIAEDVSNENSENEPSEDTNEGLLEDKNIDTEVTDLEVSEINETSNSENLPSDEGLHSEEDDNAGFETVDVVKEVINSNPEEAIDEKEGEPNLEQSEDYQRGYQEALVEFEKTLEAEKKAIADFANTLFSVRDELSSLVEYTIVEKVKEISIQFLGERIDEAPDLLVQRVKAVSSEIIENTKQVTLELNEIDATAFIENSSDLPFQVSTTPELARGEFRIIAEKSGFHQKILN